MTKQGRGKNFFSSNKEGKNSFTLDRLESEDFSVEKEKKFVTLHFFP